MTDDQDVTQAHAQIARYIRNHPDDTFQTIASRLEVAYSTISRIAKANGLSRPNNITLNPEILDKEK
jgi:DNA-binding MurR/RpiR family transcriptional regulator